MTERSFNEGDEITREGESGIGFFVIEDGNASVSVGGEIVRTLGPGEHFGEIALIDSGPRSATIIAGTDLRCRGMSGWSSGRSSRSIQRWPGPCSRRSSAACAKRTPSRHQAALQMAKPDYPTGRVAPRLSKVS